MAASATFALKPGVWFRRGRLLMVAPDSQGTACPLSGRNSTYRPVQISGTGSDRVPTDRVPVSQASVAAPTDGRKAPPRLRKPSPGNDQCLAPAGEVQSH